MLVNVCAACYANAVDDSTSCRSTGEQSRKGSDIKKKKLKPDGPINGFEYEKNKDGNLINL